VKSKQNKAILSFIHLFQFNLTSNIRDHTGVACVTHSLQKYNSPSR